MKREIISSVFRLSCLCLLAPIIGCDGDGSGSAPRDYNGVWDVRYNLTEDLCQIVEPGVLGFTDQHFIEQSGDAVSLEATTGSGVPFSGTLNDDQSFLVEQTIEGDLFGDGTFCSQTQSISYEPTDNGTASSLFLRTLSCNDGYACESRAVGETKRQ